VIYGPEKNGQHIRGFSLNFAASKFSMMELIKNIDLESLPKKKYMVIRYILDHAEEVVLLSTAELADKLSVDPVTIIKTCQEAGFKGFHDLKKRMKTQVRAKISRTPIDKFLSEFDVNTSTEEAIRNAVSRDLKMLTGTIEKISFKNIILTAEAIIRSRQTYIIGLGYIGNVANYLQSLIRSHIPQSHAITEYNGMLFDYMAHFGKGDTVIAIGFDKCQNQTIKAFKKAKQSGATTIMLADSEYSPLCKYAKIKLLVHAAPNYFLSPLIGAFSLCNAILHCIVEMTKPESTRRSTAYKKLLLDEKVYFLS